MPVIVVTGLPRSGTSMMMAMLEAGGVPCFYDRPDRPDQFNPGGYYESFITLKGDLDEVPDGHAVKCLESITALPAAFDAQVIIMRRNLNAVMDSVARKTGREAPPIRQQLLTSMDLIRLWAAGRPHIEVWYEDVIANTAVECMRIRAMTGLDINIAAMADVVRRPF